MKTFEMNGKIISPKPITFNTICELEERGFDISDLGSHTMSFIRVFVSIWGNMELNKAGDEIEQYLVDGGDISVITDAITEAVNESGFFNHKGKKTPKKALKMTEPTENDM